MALYLHRCGGTFGCRTQDQVFQCTCHPRSPKLFHRVQRRANLCKPPCREGISSFKFGGQHAVQVHGVQVGEQAWQHGESIEEHTGAVPSLGDVSEVAEVIAAEKESFARRDWDKGSSIEACAVLAPDGSARTDTDSTSDFAVSRGSFGHPHLCERVCAYAAAGLCKSGSDCSYCHITHHTKQVHLDKQNRRRLQAMSYEARAAFMLPILEQKARENDFGPACEILMTLLAKDAKLALGRDQVPCKLLGLGGLSRVMTAMSFHTVLRHLLGGLPVEAAPSTADVHLLLEAMRLHVSDTGIESGSVIPF
eukprot:CAMPEP_0170617858 /NCGR_PEP_ID=MMETSP0224-20130122/26646_1 /TAXON_ID=285029 /ORGANISM="Togula jolla, Strain CCCM 725" /LENGTH=307 /DNA_ID=CAMNT_0010943787 /DNA_START=56 /DNA_END=979 /DNA_ORIENTATION=-